MLVFIYIYFFGGGLQIKLNDFDSLYYCCDYDRTDEIESTIHPITIVLKT